MARIGLLVTGAGPHPASDAIRTELRALGYVEGRNIDIELRFGDGRQDRLAELAAELVRMAVDVVVAHQTPAARAAKDATRIIPIVMAPAGAPLETGLVTSLSRPQGNVTGVADLAAELGGRRLQFLRDIIPNLARVAALASSHDLFTRPFLQYMRAEGPRAGIEILPFMAAGPADFEKAFAGMVEARAQAVVVQGIFNPNRALTLELAARHRLPIMSWDRATTAGGGLASLSTNRAEIFRRAAGYVDRLLKGAKAAELPVAQPTMFELEINLKTAKVLGLKVPPAILIQATEVFE
ncbi:MAG: ABC transporter substrate-binding protein [Planctomycetes bacterium]|nr:ABC transporter substrate-binding protein [Planctomycetota bacterium]